MVNNRHVLFFPFTFFCFERLSGIKLETCWLDCKSMFSRHMFFLSVNLSFLQAVGPWHAYLCYFTNDIFPEHYFCCYIPLSYINLKFSFVFSLAFNNPRPGQLGRLLPNQNLPLDITLQSPTGAGPFPPIRNNSPYSVIPQPGMMGNQGMIGNQGNLGNSSTGKGSNVLLTLLVGYLT